MKNVIFASSILLVSLFVGTSAQACDMHGAGYGYGMNSANWKSYNPQITTYDPALTEQDLLTQIDTDFVPQEKVKPSFSSAAQTASMKAKAKVSLASKKSAQPADDADKKPDEKKAALNTNR